MHTEGNSHLRHRSKTSRFAAIRRWGMFAMIFLLVLGAACQSNKEDKTEVSKKDINAVLEAHSRELMEISGVVGVAIGETDEKAPCILVLVKEASDQVKRDVPKTLEGFPTRLLVTGEIKPMEGK